ncbi:DUF1302 family protein [Polaromonas sp.]|uniref:DUF1302 domain-containing protein n=1 Tax=Polaromonas sp. TaxID=1869339 RepID=UPI001DC69B3E|nr:DUF1302 family protein [Polaromonas sp.]MBT9475218.1 DUF1302 family protein [Polaromonas sp.]
MNQRLFQPNARSPRAVLGGTFAATLMLATPAMAIEIKTDNPDLSVRWDNTIRANVGVRTDKPDTRILNNPTYDESDGKFGRGDLVTKRLDLLTELDVNYKNSFGARISGAGWYDDAYSDTTVRSRVPGFATSYFNNQYNSTVKRYTRGPSGEVLDAFVWANFRVADKPANLKVGRHTNYWGEAFLLGAHAISYSQSPVDGVKAVTSPGIELKEVFLPLGQIYLKYQPTPSLSLAAQYFTEWKPSRLPYGGTYFGPADPFFEGPDRLPVDPAGNSLLHATSIKPRNSGNFGLSAKMNLEDIESTVGAYYRRFDDYNPWFSPNFTNFVAIPGVGTVPTAWQLVYPKKVEMLAASFARVVGPVSVGAEVSFRMNGALNAAGMNPVDNQGPRGDTWHALINGVYLLPKTPLADTGSLVAELAYSRLQKVNSNEAFYQRAGSAACVNPSGGRGDKSDGCSTKDYLGMAVLFTPQYLQVAPSLDVELPMSLTYGLRGNAPSSGGGKEGELSWSVGVKATYAQMHEFSLLYADTRARSKYDPSGSVLVGGSGSTGTTDRGWLALTYKTSF